MFTRFIKRGACLALAASAVLFGAKAGADGTEQLGPLSIATEEGSGFAVGGVGLFNYLPNDQYDNVDGQIFVAVPAGATVKQVLLYWNSEYHESTGPDDTARVNGVPVTGDSIGGPTVFFRDVAYESFRADITALGAVQPGANTINIAGLDPSFRSTGAGVVVIYDDGSDADMALVDGLDLAYHGFDEPLRTTVPQEFIFDASTVDRVAHIPILVGSVGDFRPNILRVTVGGEVTDFEDIFTSLDGPEWDSQLVEVDVPAGETSITVQLLSQDANRTGANPASLAWIAAGVAIAPDSGGGPEPECTTCKGFVTKVTLQYTGTVQNAKIKVVQQRKGKNVLFEGIVQPGGQFSFVGLDPGKSMGSKITLYVNGKKSTHFYAACKKDDLLKLQKKGQFKVIAGESSGGGKICPVDLRNFCDHGKPTVLKFRYTGQDCSATFHGMKKPGVDCSGDPADKSPVRMLITDKKEPNHHQRRVFFDKKVNLDEEFVVDSRTAGISRLRGNLYVFIYDSTGKNLLQKVRIHTSCNLLLRRGDQFGALRLLEFFAEGKPGKIK